MSHRDKYDVALESIGKSSVWLVVPSDETFYLKLSILGSWSCIIDKECNNYIRIYSFMGNCSVSICSYVDYIL